MQFDFHNAALVRPHPVMGCRRRGKLRRGTGQFFRPRVEQLESRQMLAADLIGGIEEPTDEHVDDRVPVEEVTIDCQAMRSEERLALDAVDIRDLDVQQLELHFEEEIEFADLQKIDCEIDFVSLGDSGSSKAAVLFSRAGIANNFEMAIAAGNEKEVSATSSEADSIDFFSFTGRVVVIGNQSQVTLGTGMKGTPAIVTPLPHSPVTPASNAGITNGFEMALSPENKAEVPTTPSEADSIDISPFAGHVAVVPSLSQATSTTGMTGTPAIVTPLAYSPVTRASSFEAHRAYFTEQSLTSARWQAGSDVDVRGTNLLDVAGPDEVQGRRVIRLAAAKAIKPAPLMGVQRAFATRSVRPLGAVSSPAARAEFVAAVFATSDSWLPASKSAFNPKLPPATLWQVTKTQMGEITATGSEVSQQNAKVETPNTPAMVTSEPPKDPAPGLRPVALLRSRSELESANSAGRQDS